MKILLLFPKPAEGLTQRESRLDHQLYCLTQVVRSLLQEANIEQNFSVREIAYLPQAAIDGAILASEIYDGVAIQDFSVTDLVTLYDDSNLVIEISGDKQTQADCYAYRGASITLRPTYPGSFAQNDIDIECKNMENSAWVTERVIEATRHAEMTARLSEYVEPDMHYSQFSPLPFRLGKEFYSRPRKHAIAVLSYTVGEDTDQTCEQDQKAIVDFLHDMEDVAALTIVSDNLQTADRAQTIADFVGESLGLETRIFAHRKGDYRDFFSALSKCDIAMFAGSSLYVDAIRLGIPSFVWRSRQEGTQPLNDAFKVLQERFDPEAVLLEQRALLDRLVESHYLGHTLPNDKRALLEALSSIISKVAPGVMVDTSTLLANPDIPEPAIGQPRIWHNDSLAIRVRHTLKSSQRKLTKFRQSPERFFEDSNHPFARRLISMIR